MSQACANSPRPMDGREDQGQLQQQQRQQQQQQQHLQRLIYACGPASFLETGSGNNSSSSSKCNDNNSSSSSSGNGNGRPPQVQGGLRTEMDQMLQRDFSERLREAAAMATAASAATAVAPAADYGVAVAGGDGGAVASPKKKRNSKEVVNSGPTQC